MVGTGERPETEVAIHAGGVLMPKTKGGGWRIDDSDTVTPYKVPARPPQKKGGRK